MEAVPGLHRSSPAELKERLVAERAGVPFLVLRDGGGRQRIVGLWPERSRLTIGRQESSDIALTWDHEVSRAHARVECIGSVWTLVDDGGSRNGTYVNDERVHGRRRLRNGDVARFGSTLVTYLAPEGTGTGSTATGRAGEPPALSDAQRRVLLALCRPLAARRYGTPPSNRELAAELHISVQTVKFHLHALFDLFALGHVPQHHKRATLARLALERGAINPRELLPGEARPPR